MLYISTLLKSADQQINKLVACLSKGVARNWIWGQTESRRAKLKANG